MTNDVLLDRQVRPTGPWRFVAASAIPQVLALVGLLAVQGGLPPAESLASLWPTWAFILGYAVAQGLLWWDGARRRPAQPMVMAFSRALLPTLVACLSLRLFPGGMFFVPLLLLGCACAVVTCAIVITMAQPRTDS
jgi:hypothetical protein